MGMGRGGPVKCNEKWKDKHQQPAFFAATTIQVEDTCDLT